VTCQDLFAAGGDTTNNTLGFCLLYMVLHPHVQSAVQKELDSVVGRDRRPSIEDKRRLVSTRSVLRITPQWHGSKSPRILFIGTKLR
jgi:cytochrome P450